MTNPTPKSSPDAANHAHISFDRVSVRYGRGPEILTDINLALPSGSFTFLTGASGAGKSSMLKLCYMSLSPSRGLVNILGHDVATLPSKSRQALKRRIGVVLQDFDLLDHLNVFENVALPLRVAGQLRQKYTTDVVELLQWVGLGHRMQALPQTLSGGEKQRAAIARAVIAKPNLLIADEPTGNVDPIMAQRLLRLFCEMNRMGTTILIATHDISLIEQVDANVLRIENGRLLSGLGTARGQTPAEASQ